MSLPRSLIRLTSVLLLGASPALAQPAAPQDSTLDNLVHAKGYVTSAAGALGAVVATDYSADSALGKRFADRANGPPLPVPVRYLWPDLERLERPLLVIQPSFTANVRADTTRNYLQRYFDEPWRGRLEARTRTEASYLENAGILVMEDQAGIVDRKIADFLKRLGK